MNGKSEKPAVVGNLTPEEREAALDHIDCDANFAKQQVETLKVNMDINPWLLQNSENLSNFNDFWDEIWCVDSEQSLDALNEATKVFFENEEGREVIPYTLHPDYRGFKTKIESMNKQLISDLLNKNLETLGLSPGKVNQDTFDHNKDTLKTNFEGDVKHAQETITHGMQALAKKFRDQHPDSAQNPTFSQDELRQYSHDIDVLYMIASGGENKEFAERLFVNLGKLSEDEKSGLTEDEIPAKERERKRQNLLSLYAETDIELDTESDAPTKNTEKVLAAATRLAWIQREMQTLDYEEQKIWLEEYIEEMNPGRTDVALDEEIDNLIKNSVVPLGAAIEVFGEYSEYAARFPTVNQRITDGMYAKNQTATASDIQQGKTDGIFPEKVNAVEVLTRCPLQSALGAYMTFAGSMGILLNVLANKGLLKDGKFVDFFTNPALLISAGYLAGGLEMVTGEKGIGSGMISDMFGKLRGHALKKDIENQKIMELWENLRSYPAIRTYTRDNFDDIKPYMDAKQEEFNQIKEQVKEKTRAKENAPKDFEEFIKQDLEAPADGPDDRRDFIKNLSGMDSFSTEETLIKIKDIYYGTHFSTIPVENQGNFSDFVDFLLNPENPENPDNPDNPDNPYKPVTG